MRSYFTQPGSLAKRNLFPGDVASSSKEASIAATPARTSSGDGEVPKKDKPAKKGPNLTKAASTKLTAVNTKTSELRVLIKEVEGTKEDLTLGSGERIFCLVKRLQGLCSISGVEPNIESNFSLCHSLSGPTSRISSTLKEGHAEELAKHIEKVELARATLEAWYSKRIPEAQIVDDERAEYDSAMRGVETALARCNGAIKSARAAIVTWKYS